MLHNGLLLKKYGIHAKDGNIGTVHDFFFDDKDWKVRYLVVDTAKFLPGKKVLISPASIDRVDSYNKNVNLTLTKEEIENSPDIDTDKPISRKYEMEHAKYFGYQPYWSGPGGWGPTAYPMNRSGQLSAVVAKEKEILTKDFEEEQDSNLRSFGEVLNYDIAAIDDKIGHVEDFILCDSSWTIRYLVVDTKNWWPGKKVLLSPEWIKEVSWKARNVHVDLYKSAIENGPEYKPEEIITREYENKLYDQYSKKKYWI